MGISIASWALILIVSVVILLAARPPIEAIRTVAKNNEINKQAAQQPAVSAARDEKQKPRVLTPEEKKILDWLKTTWPVFLFLFVFLFLAFTLIEAGQIGYLAKIVRERQASIADFFAAARASFLPLCGAQILMAALFFLIVSLGIGFVALASAILPRVLTGILGFFILIGVVIAVIWFSLRLFFYAISVEETAEGLSRP